MKIHAVIENNPAKEATKYWYDLLILGPCTFLYTIYNILF